MTEYRLFGKTSAIGPPRIGDASGDVPFIGLTVQYTFADGMESEEWHDGAGHLLDITVTEPGGLEREDQA